MVSSNQKLACFKAYDIRGRVPDELDVNLAYRIGQAFSKRFSPSKVVIGHDIRLSGPGLASALIKGFTDAGVDVFDLGLCGTEEIYFAASNLDVDGGIIVTASHNPADYNGMKLVLRDAVPISGDTGLRDLERMAVAGVTVSSEKKGTKTPISNRLAYIEHLLGYIELGKLKPLKLLVNAGNGCAGPIVDLLEKHLPFTFVKLEHEPDGTFPNGVPNPLLPENRELTALAVKEHKADLGIAWDGDFDRCFFYDERGEFIEGYYIVGMLAQAILAAHPGAKIIHDPRLTWNTIDLVQRAGGVPVMSKTGHAFIKERMRCEDAVYGGEMSAHHYFRDFSYCDSGMIPWLLVCQLLSKGTQVMSELVADRIKAYPVSGEINHTVADPDEIIGRIEKKYADSGGALDHTDGLSVTLPDYRFNIRKSNTEPLLRLNLETRHNRDLLSSKRNELLDLILQKSM